MTIRAKFYCSYVAPTGDASRTVYMQAVTSENLENKAWSSATPAGSIQMVITNPEAFGAFEGGKDYFLDFTPAE